MMIYIKHNKIAKLAMACLAIFSFTSCEEDDVFPQSATPDQNITEILASAPEASTLLGALEEFKLDSIFSNSTTYTVFAPTNDAFSGIDLSVLPESERQNALLNHVWNTETADVSSNLVTGYRETMATDEDGNNLSFFVDATVGLKFNGVASPVQGRFDLGATNGVVHMVDHLLLPPSVVDHAAANPDFSMLVEALVQTDLVNVLQGEGPFTVFAPNNAAFEMLLAQLNAAFGWTNLSDIPNDVLTQVLLHHVVSGFSLDVLGIKGEILMSAQGESFSVSGSGTTIDDASYSSTEITLTDIRAINGTVHAIDKVLLPDAIFQQVLGATLDIPARLEDRGFTSLKAAIELAGLTQSAGTDNLTVFAPNNDAFLALFALAGNFDSLDDFDTPEEIAALKKLLEYHLYTGSLSESQLTDGSSVNTVLGDSFDVSNTDAIRLKPSSTNAIPSLVESTDIVATNGLIHGINRVLVPMELIDALGISTDGGTDPVTNTDLVFFDWDGKGPWWGDVQAENDPTISLDGSSYGRANYQTGDAGWKALFFRNSSTMNGQDVVADNINDYVLKFDINILEPIGAGTFKIRFRDADGVDAFYDWQPWVDLGGPYSTNGWQTIEIPLSSLGVPDFSLVDSDFGMAWQNADVLLNFAIDNVRFEEK